MKGTNHVSNLMWQFWCMMSSCFMNVQTLGLRTENSNNNSVPKEGELKEGASTVQVRAFLLSEWNTKPGYREEGKRDRRWHLARLHLSPPQLWEYFLCWENTPEVSLLHSSSVWIQFAGQGSSSRGPSGNKASNINSQTPTQNQSFAQVLPLKRQKWNGRCPQRCQTKPTWKCFHSLDTKPFIFGSLEYL